MVHKHTQGHFIQPLTKRLRHSHTYTCGRTETLTRRHESELNRTKTAINDWRNKTQLIIKQQAIHFQSSKLIG